MQGRREDGALGCRRQVFSGVGVDGKDNGRLARVKHLQFDARACSDRVSNVIDPIESG